MRRITIPAALLMLALASQAKASIFTFDIAPHFGDQLSIKLQNWEPSFAQVTDPANPSFTGGLLFGVGRVTSVENLTAGNTAWSGVANVKELTFTFNNYTYDAANSPVGTLLFKGGNLDLWYQDLTNVGAIFTDSALANKPFGTNANPDVNDSNKFSDGTLVLQMTGHAGVTVPLNPGNPFTLKTDVTGPASGTGRGFLDSVINALQLSSAFDSNSFPTDIPANFADFNIHTTLQSATGAPAANYQIFSNDPIDTRFVGVPEPISALIWSGLGLGCVVFAWRRSCSNC